MTQIQQIAPPSSPQFDLSVKNWISVRDGISGPSGVKPDRFVSVRDLYDYDFINNLNKFQFSITKVNSEHGYTGDITAPNPPTNLQIISEVFRNTLTWDDSLSDNFWYIEVWLAKVPAGDAAPTVSNAAKIATVPKGVASFIDTEVSSTLYDHYYWIRAVSYAGIASVWQDGYISGTTTVNSTIENIMDILKGADPDAWSSVIDYAVGDRVLQGGKRYKCILAHTNQEPPNITYWEQSGILISGNVGGVSTVGIDGNLVIDGSIYADAINTDNAFIGMTIQSSVFTAGIEGWQINKNGDVEFNSGVFRGTTLWSEVSGAPADLDDIANGTTYSRVLTTAISAGKILLSSAGVSGLLPTTLSAAKCTDALADRTSANPQAVSWLADAGALATKNAVDLATAEVSNKVLDNIANGATYGKILLTDISAGHILLSACTGTLDNVGNGTTYGRVNLTAISAGKIVLTAGVTGSLPVANSDAKCTVTHTDPVIANALEENSILTSSRPVGASFSSSSGSVVGVIKITLPQSWTNTMMRFIVDVYEYTTGLSFSLQLGGYNYSGVPNWRNTTANLTGSIAANNRVRFGHDGTKCCIYIGETTSNWAHPKVSVRDFQAGHNNFAKHKWDDGWSISVTTTIGTITSDISDSLIDANAVRYVNALAATTLIQAGKIGTGLVIANSIAVNAVIADKINVVSLSAISANLGTITAGSMAAERITAGTLSAHRIGANSIVAGKIYSEAYLGGKRLDDYATGSVSVSGAHATATITHNLGRTVTARCWCYPGCPGNPSYEQYLYIVDVTTTSFKIQNSGGSTATVYYCYM